MEVGRFVNLFTDYGFKRIFGEEAGKHLLKDFLNLLLKGERDVADLYFSHTERQPEAKDGRKVIFDIHCESSDGTHFIVEMQAARQFSFYDRALYYVSRAIVEQGNPGDYWNYDLLPVYGVFFMDFTLSKDSQLRTDVALTDMATGKIVNPNMRQIFLELPRFTKEANECKDNLERWLYLIKNMGTLNDMPFMEERTEWNDLSRLASVAAMSKKEREAYEISLKHYRDYYNSIEYAKYEASKEARKEGREEGLKEGREEGLKEGREEGLKAGRTEGERKAYLEMARNLKRDGMPIALIHKYTGLTAEEIEGL